MSTARVFFGLFAGGVGLMVACTSGDMRGSQAGPSGAAGAASIGASGSGGGGAGAKTQSGSSGASGASGGGAVGRAGASGAGGSGASGAGGSGGGGSGGASAGGSGGQGAAGATTVADPATDGPYSIAEMDDTIANAPQGDSDMAVHCAYPTAGPSAGPYPVVVFARGFQLSTSQYYGYLTRLASFGYVALTVDYKDSLGGNDNPAEAHDLVAGIDWAASKASLDADASTVGVSGHSLGGKLAFLAATLDTRIKAAITLDAVDGGGGGCTAPNCVEVKSLMPSLLIPTGVIGETTDATGQLGMACAPASDNYTTFYANATSPSFSITVQGANHLSFLDDLSSCGFLCSFCMKATASQADVVSLSRAYLTAFFERNLRKNVAYENYLMGPMAQARYVATGLATIASK